MNHKLIFTLLFVIIYCNNTQQQQNGIPPIACPNYFQYLHDGSQYLGRISLPNVGNNVDLVVHFSQRTPLQTSYVGRITSESTQPIQYRVEFPTPYEVPKLTKISVNGQDICLSNDYPAPSTRLFLNHNLRITNRIQTFNQPQTSFRPQTFNQFFQQIQPQSDDAGFLTIMGFTPNTYQRPVPVQQTATPLQQFTPSPRKPPKLTPQAITQKNGNIAAGIPASQNIQCGIETNVVGFVYGGESVSRGQFPWLTAIYQKQAGLHYFCVGSLVSPRTVVSAAHCFKLNHLSADRLVVEVGRHNIDDYTEKDYVTREVQNLIIHPEYNSDTFSDADLAILQLASPVQYTRYIRPICLWTGSSDTNRIVGETAVVAGWGGDESGRKTTALPKKINTNIVSETQCIRLSHSLIDFTSNRTICAGNRDGTGPCIGDSGGGLMMYINDRWYLRGIVSAGQKKQESCDLKEYVVFCDVAKHLQWVQTQMVS